MLNIGEKNEKIKQLQLKRYNKCEMRNHKATFFTLSNVKPTNRTTYDTREKAKTT